MKTSEELGIFFLGCDGHEEVCGISFYGFWKHAPMPASMKSTTRPWDGLLAAHSVRRLEAEQGNFLVNEVRISQWPSDAAWRSAVAETLVELVRMGAVVSWCGGELCSWSLEELNPTTSCGCVYAAYSLTTGVILHSGLNDEIEYLSDQELRSLPC